MSASFQNGDVLRVPEKFGGTFNSHERLCFVELNVLCVYQSFLVTTETSSGVATSKQIFLFECCVGPYKEEIITIVAPCILRIH